MVESYIPKATAADFDPNGEVVNLTLTKGRRGRRYEPHIPHTFKERLVDALKNAHEQLLEPPERVRQDPEKLAKWRPRVKRDVDWDALLTAGASSHVHGSRTTRDAPQGSEGGQLQEDEEPEYLTVGLLGNLSSDWLLRIVAMVILTLSSRPTQCWEIITVERSIWYHQSQSIENSWKGKLLVVDYSLHLILTFFLLILHCTVDKTLPNPFLDTRHPPRRLSRPRHARPHPPRNAGKHVHPPTSPVPSHYFTIRRAHHASHPQLPHDTRLIRTPDRS